MRMLLGLIFGCAAALVMRAAYGTPTDPVTTTVITVAYAVANLLNPIRALRAFTGGADPPGTGYVVSSDSTSATSWKTILAIIGYTPVNKAGDSGIGALSASSLTSTGATAVGTTLTVTGQTTMNSHLNMGSGDQVRFATENGTKLDLASNGEYTAEVASARLILQSNRHFSFHNAAAGAGDYTLTLDSQTHAATFQGAVSAASATLSGALTAASASISGAITSVTNLTMSGALSAASASIAGAITSVTNLTMSGTLTALKAAFTQTTGTAPFTVASTTKVANLNSDLLDDQTGSWYQDRANHSGTQVASTISDFSTEVATILGGGGYGRIATGTYAGNGAASRNIAVGFAPKYVVIQRTTTFPDMHLLMGHDSIFLPSGAAVSSFTGQGFSGNNFTVTNIGANNGSATYIWVAFG